MTEASTPPGLLGHLRRLAGHSATYGLADVLPNAVNFLLLPLYTAYLTPADYGTLALLAFLSAPLKIAFRLGVDSGFFRIYYDLKTEEERRRLAGTVALFSAAIATALFAVTVLAASPIAGLLSTDQPPPARWIVLVVADLYLASYALVPQALLRIDGRPGAFAGIALGRHGAGIVLKIVLLMQGWGIEAVLWSDVIATGLYTLTQLPLLLRRSALAWSPPLLRDVLRFGLPKVPHGVLIQAQNLADRRILEAFVSRSDLGLYQMGYTLAGAVKFPLSAFEQAWQPFVYSQIGKSDAPATLARVGTYFFAAFVAAGLAVALLGREALFLLTTPAYHAAAPIIPVVAFAYVVHGFFLLTSIGIGISKQARYYPLVTLIAAATNIAANFLLIPRWGLMGAAWATVASYAVMAGVGFVLSQRLHPLPMEWSRYLRLVVSAAAIFAVSRLTPEAIVPALAVKGALLLVFPVLLLLLGFWSPAEVQRLRQRLTR